MSSTAIKPDKIVSLEQRMPGSLFQIECNRPDPLMIADLEELLERAKRGDIRAIAYAYQCGPQGVGRGAHLGSGSAAHLNYALDWLKEHLLHYDE